MIFDFLKKQRDLSKKRKLIEIMITSLNIPEQQKELYLEAINILSIEGLENLYITLSNFSKEIEIENIEKINKQQTSKIAGIRKKEAIEKQKEINSFSFLISNL